MDTHSSRPHDDMLIWLTWSIRPPPFTITNDRNPENKTGVTHPVVTRTIHPPPWPYEFKTPTTSPSPTTHGSSTLHSSIHGTKPTERSGPRCKRNCGTKCKIFCSAPCFPLFCPPDGGGGSDFNDPGDPNPPPLPPRPGPQPGDTEGPDPCKVKQNIGRCENGNMPVWDSASGGIRYDLPDKEAEDNKSGCQKDIENNPDKAKETLENAKACCSSRSAGDLFAAAPACPNGRYHSVFTCDHSLWPNVCANARSAIEMRGKPSILTYVTATGKKGHNHETGPWSSGKHWGSMASGKGWALRNCEIEEYPFASSDPNRKPNNKIWSQQRVLRLIPQDENKAHGSALGAFYRREGNGDSKRANGLIYSMSFTNGPTGKTDDDFYLGTGLHNAAMNACARPHGIAYLLVNKANTNKNDRKWDPWWDDKLIKKTIEYKTNNQGTATSIKTAMLPSMYCKHPSPGNLVLDTAQQIFTPEINPPPRLDRRGRGKRFWSCDDFVNYSGPRERPPVAPGVSRKRTGVDDIVGPTADNSNISARHDEEDILDGDGLAELFSTPEEVKSRPAYVFGDQKGVENIGLLVRNVPGDHQDSKRVPELLGGDPLDNRHNAAAATKPHQVPNRQVQQQEKRPLDLIPHSLLTPRPRFAHDLVSRATGGGGFLDPDAFNYLCGSFDDSEVVCPNGCNFPDPNGSNDDDEVDDDGEWGDDDAPGSGGGGDDDDDDDDDDDPGQPAAFNYGFRWGGDDCRVLDVTTLGNDENRCHGVEASGPKLVAAIAKGFVKDGYTLCFYTNTNCQASNSKEFAILKGGDRITNKNPCVEVNGGKQIMAYEVVKGHTCRGDPNFLDKPDPSRNQRNCYNTGKSVSRAAALVSAESFRRDVKNYKSVWSNDKLEMKKTPAGGYHFKFIFQTADYNECMRYMEVNIDSCDCDGENGKHGGWMENNCIRALIDPNTGL
ncbi:hypothetical protein HJFPF1_12271 [Paramyrothecium foliicola]|nr:hypothetical protein HJFPF1_12271 [Paramyrothecium foliicola]